ncbi:MAG: fibrobacter succinogenes major paralogous domain-containing protein [Fibromonadaceae bacterium]|jgi:uncharacterized protein (TIGR02145 family)|nr:fibrobacter succinogenes major paralogous domain-containing protein [Fibromonadaceae bacterium]
MLNEELAEIEEVVSEWEEKIKDGRHSVENLQKQIEGIADADTVMAKMNSGDNEWLNAWKKETIELSGIPKINMSHLGKLKYQHPNDPRISKLGNRAVKCYLKLCEINCTVTERLADSDLRPQIQAENQKMMSELRSMYSTMFPHTEETQPSLSSDSPFVPSSQSHFADIFDATAKQNIENARKNAVTNDNSSSVRNLNTKANVPLIMGIIGVLCVIAIIAYFIIQSMQTSSEINEQAIGAESENSISSGNTFTDSRESKTYKTVKIGSQTWMAENLNIEKGNSVCYDNDPANCQKCGRLYDWETAMKICPKGWHLPTDAEWNALENAVGGSSVVGTVLKSKNGWDNNGNGTDKHGFSALPCGRYYNGKFLYYGLLGQFWSATETSASHALGIGLDARNADMGVGNLNKSLYLRSVRCVED